MSARYLSASETAAILGLTQRRVNQLARAHELESVRIGNSNAIDPVSIQQYIKKAKRPKKNGNDKK